MSSIIMNNITIVWIQCMVIQSTCICVLQRVTLQAIVGTAGFS